MTERLRAAAQALVDRWDSPQWGGSAENLRHTGEYIAALRDALAEQPAEPVAWQGVYDPTDLYWRKPPQTDVRPLYTAPQPAKRVPLIADEICDFWEFITGHQIQFGPSSEGRPMYLSTDEVIEFARAIERAHGITGGAK